MSGRLNGFNGGIDIDDRKTPRDVLSNFIAQHVFSRAVLHLRHCLERNARLRRQRPHGNFKFFGRKIFRIHCFLDLLFLNDFDACYGHRTIERQYSNCRSSPLTEKNIVQSVLFGYVAAFAIRYTH